MGGGVKQCEVYRQRATELEKLAESVSMPSTRDHYLRLAEEWRRLDESTEAMAERWGAKSH